jgi:LmbE family N-acetylglucosaminyl deacetylase
LSMYNPSMIRKIIRKVYFGIHDSSLYDLMNEVYFQKLFDKKREELNGQIKILDQMPGERVLVLAPHCDDEIIGCGGAILSYLEQEKEVYVAYLTNGQKQGTGQDVDQVVLKRQTEAYEVADSLGIPQDHIHFLGGTDGSLLSCPIEDGLSEVLRKVRPDRIFLPLSLDIHPDHYAASKKLLAVYEQDATLLDGTHVVLYESQSPLTLFHANLCLRITNKLNRKIQLLNIFRSQPYPFKFVINLNRMNGYFLGKGEASESYLQVKTGRFVDFLKRNFLNDEAYFQLRTRLVPNRHSASLRKSYENGIQERELLRNLWSEEG